MPCNGKLCYSCHHIDNRDDLTLILIVVITITEALTFSSLIMARNMRVLHATACKFRSKTSPCSAGYGVSCNDERGAAASKTCVVGFAIPLTASANQTQLMMCMWYDVQSVRCLQCTEHSLATLPKASMYCRQHIWAAAG